MSSTSAAGGRTLITSIFGLKGRFGVNAFTIDSLSDDPITYLTLSSEFREICRSTYLGPRVGRGYSHTRATCSQSHSNVSVGIPWHRHERATCVLITLQPSHRELEKP